MEKFGFAVIQTAMLRHRIGVEAGDAEIYVKYADDLIRYATGLVGPSDAKDVVSDAVLACLASYQWSTVTDKRPYLYRSVYNKAAELHRSSRRRRSREERTATRDLVEMSDPRPEVLEAVFRLSLKQRSVIVLTYWEDLTASSIASLMQISEGSVKRHLDRGRTRLKEALASHE